MLLNLILKSWTSCLGARFSSFIHIFLKFEQVKQEWLKNKSQLEIIDLIALWDPKSLITTSSKLCKKQD